MAFLTLNGVTVNCALDATLTPVRIGDSDRSLNGTARVSWRATKREWALRTVPLVKATADAFRAFVDGEGQAFSFNTDLYSAKGLGTSATTGTVTIGTSAPTPKYGAGRIQATGSSSATWATNLGSNWTAWLWHYSSSTWSHWIVTSGGSKWLNGSTSVASTAFLSVASGSVTLSTVSSALQADDLVVLPAVIPTEWAAEIYAYHNAQAWSSVRRLVANGTMVASTATSVVGEVTGTTPVDSGSDLYEMVDFTLREV